MRDRQGAADERGHQAGHDHDALVPVARHQLRVQPDDHAGYREDRGDAVQRDHPAGGEGEQAAHDRERDQTVSCV